MKTELNNEIERLKHILESNGLEFNPVAGTTADKLAEVESKIGFTLDEDLKSMWRFSNGSDSAYWFTVFSDEQTPCTFPSVENALNEWSAYLPYDNPVYDEYQLSEDERDERIQPTLIHKFWFPFAEFNGFSTSIRFDADPTEKGNYGQIIVYQHDPDGIYYVAQNFLEFFKKSNDELEANFENIILLD